MEKYVHKLKDKHKATFYWPSEVWLVTASTIFEETGGKIICGEFQSINAHVEQERSDLSGTGDCSSIQNPYNGCHSQWSSANKREINRKRPRPQLLVTVQILEDTPAVLPLGKTLRRSRILI